MGIAVPAPSMTGVNIGGIFSNGTKVATGGLGPVVVGLGAIFASQSLGEDSDKIPGVTGQPQEGGLNNPGVMMGGRTQTQSQSKVEEKDATCTADNQKCKQEAHRGNIQAQQEKKMLVETPANSRWNVPKPHGYTFAMAAATSVRLALLAQRKQGVDPDPKLDLMPGDRGKIFQQGADAAHANILAILKKYKELGLFNGYEVSCYFNGTRANGSNSSLKKELSRRIDLAVKKGQLMGPGTK